MNLAIEYFPYVLFAVSVPLMLLAFAFAVWTEIADERRVRKLVIQAAAEGYERGVASMADRN